MVNDIIKDAETRMKKSIDSLRTELQKVRTGRAHPSLLEHIVVDYYGAETPLSQVASIGVEDARTLTVTPWERPMVQAVEKAIMNSDLGLNPNSAGTVIRIPMPQLTEERRRDLVKVVKGDSRNPRYAASKASSIMGLMLGKLNKTAGPIKQETEVLDYVSEVNTTDMAPEKGEPYVRNQENFYSDDLVEQAEDKLTG